MGVLASGGSPRRAAVAVPRDVIVFDVDAVEAITAAHWLTSTGAVDFK
jgi:hypothetical protein